MSKKEQDRKRMEVTLDFWRGLTTERLLERLNTVGIYTGCNRAIRTVLRERGIDPRLLNTGGDDERAEGA
jgi:hypothetical protein